MVRAGAAQGPTEEGIIVGNVTTGGMVPVAAQGDCAGRLPGGL